MEAPLEAASLAPQLLRENHCPLCGACGHALRLVLPDKRTGHERAAAGWPLMRCNYCNVLFLAQRPPWSGGAEAASDRAEDVGDVQAVQAAGGATPQVVVAFGSGLGRELEAWRSHYPHARLIGLDRDPSCTDALVARGFEAVQARMEDATLACASLVGQCDVVLCIDALDEADDPRAALHAARALLKTGGFLVVRGIDAGGAQERRFRSGAWHAYAAPMRAYYYNPFNLARLVGSEGFEKVSVDSLPDARGWIRSWRAALTLQGCRRPGVVSRRSDLVALVVHAQGPACGAPRSAHHPHAPSLARACGRPARGRQCLRSQGGAQARPLAVCPKILTAVATCDGRCQC